MNILKDEKIEEFKELLEEEERILAEKGDEEPPKKKCCSCLRTNDEGKTCC